MDFWEVIGSLGWFLGGIIATLLFLWLAKREAFRISQTVKSGKAIEAKQEQSVRLMAFLAELKGAYDEAAAGGQVDLKEFGLKKALPIVLKYPDVVAKHGKQLLKLMGGSGNEFSGLLDGLV